MVVIVKTSLYWKMRPNEAKSLLYVVLQNVYFEKKTRMKEGWKKLREDEETW